MRSASHQYQTRFHATPKTLQQVPEIYRDAVKNAGLGWTDVEGHVLAYAAKQGWTSEKTADELERVRAFLKM
ncbi:hypothetical protein [Gluconacetobacter diazotrophicus]|uniref:hypothetical protein n=1 Tax=Gluconacetobacter diazotrophicus TaxID=33996 RepID=UPI0012FF1072|nr:hypothetical protein [Gluconacetobacter diazotrophicus]